MKMDENVLNSEYKASGEVKSFDQRRLTKSVLCQQLEIQKIKTE